MKKAILPLLLLLLAASAGLAQNIKLYYLTAQKEKVYLTQDSDYDTENKPSLFFLDKPDKKSIYIVEVYRIIHSQEHFYKSWSMTDAELEGGFNTSALFSDVTSPFIHPSAILIKICRTSQQNYLKLKQREDCALYQEFRLRIPQ
ncbi:MAG: hypothetical protein L6Q78_15670 [Bacteroidia bacterium]|nr:hypothetical protein [Bacteroidia bacterium]